MYQVAYLGAATYFNEILEDIGWPCPNNQGIAKRARPMTGLSWGSCIVQLRPLMYMRPHNTIYLALQDILLKTNDLNVVNWIKSRFAIRGQLNRPWPLLPNHKQQGQHGIYSLNSPVNPILCEALNMDKREHKRENSTLCWLSPLVMRDWHGCRNRMIECKTACHLAAIAGSVHWYFNIIFKSMQLTWRMGANTGTGSSNGLHRLDWNSRILPVSFPSNDRLVACLFVLVSANRFGWLKRTILITGTCPLEYYMNKTKITHKIEGSHS